MLNALKEVHLILAEGAHNQFGDLTWTARAEMLTIQWMLARPEMKEFLRGRYMVPYQEDWMGAVDSMKKLQGWTDTTITHFYELAVTGERILLSIRYGDWSDIENIEDQAKNWARSCKPEIQRYIHGYRTVTGVDLAADITDSRDAATRYLQPSVLLQRRLTEQRSAMPLRGPERSRPRRGESVGPGRIAQARPAQIAGLQEGKLRRGGSDHARLHIRALPGHSSCPPRRCGHGRSSRPAGRRRSNRRRRPRSWRKIWHNCCAVNGRCSRRRRFTSYWDLFDVLARDHIAIYADAGTYPIARWGIERAAAKGVPTATFQTHDPAALEVAPAS